MTENICYSYYCCIPYQACIIATTYGLRSIIRFDKVPFSVRDSDVVCMPRVSLVYALAGRNTILRENDDGCITFKSTPSQANVHLKEKKCSEISRGTYVNRVRRTCVHKSSGIMFQSTPSQPTSIYRRRTLAKQFTREVE